MLPHKHIHTHIHTEIPFYHLILSMHFISHTTFILFVPFANVFVSIINISVLKQTKTNKHYICYALCFPLPKWKLFTSVFYVLFSYLLLSKWILLYICILYIVTVPMPNSIIYSQRHKHKMDFIIFMTNSPLAIYPLT